jgi:hypothetical protein
VVVEPLLQVLVVVQRQELEELQGWEAHCWEQFVKKEVEALWPWLEQWLELQEVQLGVES